MEISRFLSLSLALSRPSLLLLSPKGNLDLVERAREREREREREKKKNKMPDRNENYLVVTIIPAGSREKERRLWKPRVRFQVLNSYLSPFLQYFTSLKAIELIL